MSDYDRRIRSQRASWQLHLLSEVPQLWRFHDLMEERVSRRLPPLWGDVWWRRGDMTAKIAGLSARMATAWRKLSHRVAVPIPETAEPATLQHHG